MSKVKNKEKKVQTGIGDYVSIKAFQDYIARNKSPYSTNFSFRPFFNGLRGDEAFNTLSQSVMMVGIMDDFEEKLSSITSEGIIPHKDKALSGILSLLFPALFFRGQIGFIGTPITKKLFFLSPEMDALFSSEDWEVKMPELYAENMVHRFVLEAGDLILSRLYNYELPPVFLETIVIRHRKTKLEKHYKVKIIRDYIDVTPLKPLRELDDAKINQLLNDWGNAELWQACFPFENFHFEGLIIGTFTDVTDVGILSQLKEHLMTGNNSAMGEDYQFFNQMTRSYMGMPDIEFGTIITPMVSSIENASWSLLGGMDESFDPFSKTFESNIYRKVFSEQEAVVIDDLQAIKDEDPLIRILKEKGFRSLLLAPLKNTDGEGIGVFELANKKPFQFTSITLMKMDELIQLFGVGISKWLNDMNTMVNLYIQKQYTSIHSSVKWRFEEVAQKHLFLEAFTGKKSELESIAFPDVYPLYGQADIVGSSQLRNESIQTDLIDNLERVNEVMNACRKCIDFQLLDTYLTQTKSILARLKKGKYISSDESQIVELLTKEVHPLLLEMHQEFEAAPKEILQKYFDYLDPHLNIVYRRRKAYEQSVSRLNKEIADFVEKEDAAKQKVLPHFFEKYTTDGVEYNLYIGQSLLQNGKFSSFFLKDFRLWQLIMMCEITRRVKKLSSELPVPLTTAQLIFVYNNSLSIRFHMEEKQFDVDGAYNVRYEILKKRIDKAYIKGTKERLTVSGKIAIVWLQEKDRKEYMEYLKHLIQKGYITENIEDLILEKLQGADGLKALRVEVV